MYWNLTAVRAGQVGSVDSILSQVPMRTIAEVLQDKYGRLPAEDTPERAIKNTR